MLLVLDCQISFGRLPTESFACKRSSMLKMMFSGVLLDVSVAECLACPKNLMIFGVVCNVFSYCCGAYEVSMQVVAKYFSSADVERG